MKLPKEFYTRSQVLDIAKDLLGKILVTNIQGKLAAGIIVETEAYNGIYDKACHAYGGRKTERNKVMYEEGGISYVYFCYGMHYLFNVVTNKKHTPDAVLIRGLLPYEGETEIFKRLPKPSLKRGVLNGPGKVTKAMGIDKTLNGVSLSSSIIWIKDEGIQVPLSSIISCPRVGVDYAGEDALLPYRFLVKEEFIQSLRRVL